MRWWGRGRVTLLATPVAARAEGLPCPRCPLQQDSSPLHLSPPHLLPSAPPPSSGRRRQGAHKRQQRGTQLTSAHKPAPCTQLRSFDERDRGGRRLAGVPAIREFRQFKRLGRSWCERIRVCHRLGQSRRRADGQATLDTSACVGKPNEHSQIGRALMAFFKTSDGKAGTGAGQRFSTT